MKSCSSILSFIILSLILPIEGHAKVLHWPHGLPVYDHIVIIMDENKNYDEIIGDTLDPYINQLVKESANFTRMFAEEHKSEGNYFWLMAGTNSNVGFVDEVPNKQVFVSNLGEQLIKKGLTFKGYAESLPAVGSPAIRVYPYARKHVPWISFGNLPGGNNPDSSINLQFAQFPTDFNKLPTVSFVIPDLVGDMHDPSDVKVSIPKGDEWLRKNMDAYYQWAKTHNSLLIITFDENEDPTNYTGLTNPASKDKVVQNRIPTFFAGAHIKPGNYPEGRGITHVNILRTLEAMYGLPTSGEQQKFALKYGIKSNYIITDVFDTTYKKK
jgi:phosphatidylinositol-3-phosphatase